MQPIVAQRKVENKYLKFIFPIQEVKTIQTFFNFEYV